MTILTTILICLIIVFITGITAIVGIELVERIEKLRDPNHRVRKRNFIVINGHVYWPKNIGRETDCKTECKLYNLCTKGSHSICEALGQMYDDVIMTDEDERK